LARLTTNQIRFVVSRQDFQTDREAAEAIGLKPDTVYRWPEDVKLAVQLMAQDGLVVASHIRRTHVAKAMLVKVGALDSDDESARQKAATEIIEWEMGKAVQRQEHTGAEGAPIEVSIGDIREQLIDRINRIAARDEADSAHSGPE